MDHQFDESYPFVYIGHVWTAPPTEIQSAFHLDKKKSGNFSGNKNGFPDRLKVVPFGRKRRNGADPVTRWDTKMAAELVTTENGKRVNGTRN